MQVQFKNALFNSDLFNFAVVNGSVLTIVLDNAEVEIDFASEAEAVAAQAELGELLDSVNSVSSGIASAANAVAGLFSGVFGSAKTKVTKAGASKASDLEKFLEDALATFTQQATQQATPSTNTKAAAEANDVFGTTRTERADSANVVVSQLSDAALRTAIEDKAAILIETDARVQALIAQLRRFYTDAHVEEVIEIRKEQVFQYARQNGSLTLNQIIERIL